MQALQFSEYGPISNLKINKIDQPKIQKPTDVKIQVKSSSINPIDYILRRGYLQQIWPLNLPSGIGFDVSGIVVEVGDEVKNFKKGDEVFSRIESLGTLQEYVIASEFTVGHKPKSLSWNESASLPLATLTAYQVFVNKAKLKKGDKVFISGGSGGVGTFAVQYVKKVIGAYVAITTSGKNAQLLKELGADEIIDYTKEDFTQKLKDFDVSLDLAKEGGKVIKVLKRGGKAYSANIAANEEILNLAKEYDATYEYFWMSPNGKDLETIGGFYDQKIIKPIIDSVFEFKDFEKAFERLESGRTVGKIVIEISK